MIALLLGLIFSSHAQVKLPELDGEFIKCGVSMSGMPLYYFCPGGQGFVRPDTPVREVNAHLPGRPYAVFKLPDDCNTVSCLYPPRDVVKQALGPTASFREVFLFEWYPLFRARVEEDANEDDPSYLGRLNGKDPTLSAPVTHHCVSETMALPAVAVLASNSLESIWAQRGTIHDEALLRRTFCALKQSYESRSQWEKLMQLIAEMPFEHEDCVP